MQLGRCPVCRARIDLESVIQDQETSNLMLLLAKQPKEVGVHLVSYLALFRPHKSDLKMSRALDLAREVVAMQGPLAIALERTVEGIAQQRLTQTSYQPLKNHNYLKRVLESLAANPSGKRRQPPQELPQKPPGQVKGEQHKAEEMRHDKPMSAAALMQQSGVLKES